ncbi:hypothetical protein NMY22_g12240 [Coprinellus aureogranulatus]|nr:hypothetical protein NMY22_g12240 [Coprinellus aureogranulatus]
MSHRSLPLISSYVQPQPPGAEWQLRVFAIGHGDHAFQHPGYVNVLERLSRRAQTRFIFVPVFSGYDFSGEGVTLLPLRGLLWRIISGELCPWKVLLPNSAVWASTDLFCELQSRAFLEVTLLELYGVKDDGEVNVIGDVEDRKRTNRKVDGRSTPEKSLIQPPFPARTARSRHLVGTTPLIVPATQSGWKHRPPITFVHTTAYEVPGDRALEAAEGENDEISTY